METIAVDITMERPAAPRVRRYRNVSRIDHGYFHGWAVVVKRRGETYRKCFRDGRYGSRGESLTAALAYRNELLARFPESSVRRRNVRNTTGVVGVVLVTHRPRPGNGAAGKYYIATWAAGGGRRRVRWFSVAKYGEEKARNLAVAARQEGTGENLAQTA